VSVYTTLFTDSGADVNAYLRGVGALCETYAVTDWEREPNVARGIARGLTRSRLSAREVDVFIERVSGGDAGLRDGLRTAARAQR